MRSLRSVTITIGISSTFKRKQWFPTMDHLPFSFPIKFSIQFSFLHFFFKSKHKFPNHLSSHLLLWIESASPSPYKISTPLNLPSIELKIILHHFLIPPKIPNSECIRLDCISIMRLPRSSNGGKGEEGESWEKGHVPSTFRAHA